MSSAPSNPPAYRESLGTKLDKVADALTSAHAVQQAAGVSVSVHADGRVVAVHIDEDVFPGGRQLGPLLTRLLNGAREQAQAEVEDLVREAWADPRVADVVAEIGDAPERSLPPAVGANPATSPSTAHDYGRGDPADEDYSPLRPRSPIAADNDW